MKILTIKEPWASLIINGYKKYEFRSWKTKYRGKILIHASKGVDKENINYFSSFGLNYKPSYVLGEAYLDDCIEVTKDFEDKLLKENAKVYGKTLGRKGYAWHLKDIKIYDKPYQVKGNLGIWNYYNEKEIMEILEQIEYGYLDKSKQIHHNSDGEFQTQYRLQSPKETLKNKIGVCWDQVELERYLFKNNYYVIKTFIIVNYQNECKTHTFLTYKKDNKYYWFEHSWYRQKGIHEYNSLKELLIDVKEKFIKYEIGKSNNNIIIREYEKPKYNISVEEFYKHFEKYPIIEIDDINE